MFHSFVDKNTVPSWLKFMINVLQSVCVRECVDSIVFLGLKMNLAYTLTRKISKWMTKKKELL